MTHIFRKPVTVHALTSDPDLVQPHLDAILVQQTQYGTGDDPCGPSWVLWEDPAIYPAVEGDPWIRCRGYLPQFPLPPLHRAAQEIVVITRLTR